MSEKVTLVSSRPPLIQPWSSDSSLDPSTLPEVKDSKDKPFSFAINLKGAASADQAVKSKNPLDKDHLPSSDSAVAPQFSIAQRTQQLYRQQSSMASSRTVTLQTSAAIQEALTNDLESHRVMYQHLFTENKTRSAKQPEVNADNSSAKSLYISALNTRRNPDVLVPGARFLKGNAYFQSEAGLKEQESSKEEGEESDDERSSLNEAQNDFNRLVTQQARYFRDNNITIKCRNCLKFGHMARDCHNKTKKYNCILCGKDTHDSFSCTEKICFKCNKVGHLAIACKEKNIIKCNRCGLNGHKEMRCLKYWMGDYTESQMQFLRCIECGKAGHVKCTKERQSQMLPIDTMIRDDLQEFSHTASVSPSKKGKKNKSAEDDKYTFDYIEALAENSWLKENTNVQLPKTYSSVYRNAQQTYGLPRGHRPRDAYCCYCGERHLEEQCSYYKTGNQKFQQFEKIRSKLNQEDYYDYDYNSYYYNQPHQQAYSNNRSSSYSQRLAQDPRHTRLDTQLLGKRKHHKVDSSSSSSDEEDEEIVTKIGDANQKSKKPKTKSSSSGSSDIEDHSDSSDDEASSSANEDLMLLDFDEMMKRKKQKKSQPAENNNNHRKIVNHYKTTLKELKATFSKKSKNQKKSKSAKYWKS